MPAGARPEMAQVIQGMEQAMSQLSAPLPDEAVGKGASWQVQTKLSQNGVSLTQTATYSLTDLDGDALTLDVKIAQSAPKQKVASPMGVTVDLTSLSSTGGGKSKLRLDRLSPLESLLSVASTVTMAVPVKTETKNDGEPSGEAPSTQTKSMKMVTKMVIAVMPPAP
jgi:hypothetical protein